jgi:hypothetical protein
MPGSHLLAGQRGLALDAARALARSVSADVLASTVALQARDAAAARRHLESAVRREDAPTYDEPPPWYHSTRNMLGIVNLVLGDPTAAELAFRDDLRAYRENGWSLAGLERALRRLRRTDEAGAIAARLNVAWRSADAPALPTR